MTEENPNKPGLRHSKHLSREDMALLDESTRMSMLNNKYVMRANNESSVESLIEGYFMWLRDTCEHFYHVDGPHHKDGDILYYIYLADKDESVQFKLTF